MTFQPFHVEPRYGNREANTPRRIILSFARYSYGLFIDLDMFIYIVPTEWLMARISFGKQYHNNVYEKN